MTKVPTQKPYISKIIYREIILIILEQGISSSLSLSEKPEASSMVFHPEEENEKQMFLNFILRLLQWRPEDRSNVDELISDPWLQEELGY